VPRARPSLGREEGTCDRQTGTLRSGPGRSESYPARVDSGRPKAQAHRPRAHPPCGSERSIRFQAILRARASEGQRRRLGDDRCRASSAWPESHGRARELLRNSLRSFPDPDSVPKKQIGLRYAAAKLPGLRTGRGGRNLVDPSGRWWTEEPIVDSEALPSPRGPSPRGRCVV